HLGRITDRTSLPVPASRWAVLGLTFPLYPAKRAQVVPLALVHSERREVRRPPGPCYPAEMGRQFPGLPARYPPARKVPQGILVLANQEGARYPTILIFHTRIRSLASRGRMTGERNLVPLGPLASAG